MRHWLPFPLGLLSGLVLAMVAANVRVSAPIGSASAQALEVCRVVQFKSGITINLSQQVKGFAFLPPPYGNPENEGLFVALVCAK